jgi:hypothetical protein
MIEYDENDISSSDYDEIDNFLDNYSDSIYLLYEEIKSNFESNSPFFLCKMRFYHITTFLIDILFKSESESKLNDERNPFSLINDFNNYYKNEISYSFNIIYAYIKKHFKYTIRIEYWIFFCYNLSDIGEIQKVR